VGDAPLVVLDALIRGHGTSDSGHR
jgi:hypothetical protein